MTAVPATPSTPATQATTPATRTRSVPGSGWTVVAAKEFGDHLLSARFFVLVIVLGLAAAIPLYFAAAAIREVAYGRHRHPGHLHRAVLARPGRW